MKVHESQKKIVTFIRFLYQTNVISERSLDHVESHSLAPDAIKEFALDNLSISNNYFDMLLNHYNALEQLDVGECVPDEGVLKLIPSRLAKSHSCILINKDEEQIYVAMKNPLDQPALAMIRRYTKTKLKTFLVDSRDLEKLLTRCSGGANEIRRLAGDLSLSMKKNNESSEIEQEEADWFNKNARRHPAVRLLREIVSESIRLEASDIHLEEDGGALRIRLRVEGDFINYDLLESEISAYIFRLVLILARLDIIESRLPQEGGFYLVINNSVVNLRLSVMPTHTGRTAVMRVLESDKSFRHLAQLIKEPELLSHLRNFIMSKHGLLFVTGPTSSGKTTTLYTLLKELHALHSKILTLEDPVEMTVDGINQIEVKPDLGYNYIEGLKSAFRQDPNVLMIGEIREQEPAQMVVRASNSGMKVMTSLHAQTCVSTIIRMIDFGVDPAYLAGSVSLILNQRLVHNLCEYCSQPHKLSITEISFLKIHDINPNGPYNFRESVGCKWCEFIGSQGRQAVIEYLVMTDEFKRVLLSSNFTRERKSELINELFICSSKQIGNNDLQTKALKLACSGQVSLQEVMSLRENLVDVSKGELG
jgi:type II secretory ATPase GspE/PulE/Tfp pilus assembly ATPase PilB-like protein